MSSLHVAFRADGDERIGAGHVGRCLPLAHAFRARGHSATFVGDYAGLAAWMLERSRVPVMTPVAGAPAGVPAELFDAAVVDSYELASASVCRLARERPVATLAEAHRCPHAGVLIDYHVDRAGEAPSQRLLPGPAYAPIDPRFRTAGATHAPHEAAEVAAVLVAVGGGRDGHAILEPAVAAVRCVFPQARVLVAADVEIAGERVERLPSPSLLSEAAAHVDLAVTAAGLTAYELACAGVPAVLVAIAENQRRVARACAAAEIALAVDADARDFTGPLRVALKTLRDPARRTLLAERGRRTFDGHGAERAVVALLERWKQKPRRCEAFD